MKDWSLIDKISPAFIALTATPIHQCLSAWNTGEWRVPLEFVLGGGAQCKCNTTNNNNAFNIACTDVFRQLDVDFCSTLPAVQTKKIDNIRSMICCSMQCTGTDPAMAQCHNNQGSCDEDFIQYVPEELIEQSDNSFNHITNCVAATEHSMRLTAVLQIGWLAIASCSEADPCSDSNSNRNDVTNITSIGNTGLVDGSTSVEGAMLLGG